MIARLLKSRLFVGVASAATALALIGGVAYANTLVQPSSSDKYYACFSNTDYLKGKIYLNMAPPSCPAVTDVIRTWDAVKGAVGATGPSGSNGVAGATGPSGATGSGGDSYRPVNLCTSIPGPYMNFSTCNLANYQWQGTDLHGTMFRKTNLHNALLDDADLTSASLKYADLSDAVMSSADLAGAELYSADLAGADLEYANLSGVNLTNAHLNSAYLGLTNLTNAVLRGAYLASADLSAADLSGADLSHANLTGVIGTPLNSGCDHCQGGNGVIYNNTICPSGVNSDTNNAPYFDCSGQGW